MDHNELRQQAEEFLQMVRAHQEILESTRAQAEAEMEEVRKKYAEKIEQEESEVEALDKELVRFMRTNSGALFVGRDQVTLDSGILVYGEKERVQIPRDALAQIKAQGWTEAVKVAESVDRSVVEKWPTERLAVIGARKKTVRTYSYELKEKK